MLSAQTPSRLCPLQRHDLPGAVRPDDEWHRLVRQSSSRRVWRGPGGTPALGSMGSESSWGPETRMTCGQACLRIDLRLTAQTQASGRTAARTPCDRARARGVHGQRASDPSWRPSPEAEPPMDTSGRASTRWT